LFNTLSHWRWSDCSRSAHTTARSGRSGLGFARYPVAVRTLSRPPSTFYVCKTQLSLKMQPQLNDNHSPNQPAGYTRQQCKAEHAHLCRWRIDGCLAGWRLEQKWYVAARYCQSYYPRNTFLHAREDRATLTHGHFKHFAKLFDYYFLIIFCSAI